MSKQIRLIVFTTIWASISAFCFGQDLEATLRTNLLHQVVQLKVPYSDPTIKFFSDGTTGATKQGPWTLDGKIKSMMCV